MLKYLMTSVLIGTVEREIFIAKNNLWLDKTTKI